MSKLTKLQIKANVRAWLTDLESGNYNQTTGVLKDAQGFCCLGVGCVTLGIREFLMYTDEDETICFGPTKQNSSDTVLPGNSHKKFGLAKGTGVFVGRYFKQDDDKHIIGIFNDIGHGGNYADNLTALNDELSLNFSQIAAFIRTKPKGLFVDNLWDDGEVI